MFCENCNEKIPDGSQFCTHCGTKQTGNLAATQSGAVGQSYQPAERISSPPVQNTKRPVYTQQPHQNSGDLDLITMGQYLIMFLIMAIPIAGIVMLFIWSFGGDTGPNKKNFARAYLVMMLIALGVAIIMSIVMAIFAAAMMSTLYY